MTLLTKANDTNKLFDIVAIINKLIEICYSSDKPAVLMLYAVASGRCANWVSLFVIKETESLLDWVSGYRKHQRIKKQSKKQILSI